MQIRVGYEYKFQKIISACYLDHRFDCCRLLDGCSGGI